MQTWSRTGAVIPERVAQLPGWLQDVAAKAATMQAEDVTRWVPPHGEGRHSAVLILFSDDRDLLIIQRASTMRSHAGQPAFPGGGLDEGDEDAAAAAVREAVEETGLDPSGVVVFGALPDLWVPVSDYVVTPVLAYWRAPSPVHAQDRAEVESVHRIPIVDLADPAHRCRVQHPSGYVGPGFQVDGLLIWGFTGGIIATLLDTMAWSVPWDESRIVPLD